jgi:hypothetical protein
LGWREQFETVAGGRRTVELKVQRPPCGCVSGASRTLRVRRTFRCDTGYGRSARGRGSLWCGWLRVMDRHWPHSGSFHLRSGLDTSLLPPRYLQRSFDDQPGQ